jgi:regulator of RNase E activity RraB
VKRGTRVEIIRTTARSSKGADTLEHHWDCYLCKVNGKLASIFLDRNLQSSAPDAKRSWLLWLRLNFNSPRPDGLSSREELDQLLAVEKPLRSEVESKCNAVYTGTITTDGGREFYWYAPSAEHFERAARAVMSVFKGYKFELGAKRDPSWTLYMEVLSPTPEQLQVMGNRSVLDSMREQGDALETSREVSHWIYFGSAEDRSRFEKEALRLGFQVNSQYELEERERTFAIVVVKENAMTQQGIDADVLALFRAALASDGEYDGWEAEVIRATDADTPSAV